YHAGRDKVLLRNYLEAAMPGLPERAAAGPALPLAGFMATQPLREMIDTCLSEASVKRRGLFEWEGLRRLLLGARGGDALCLRQTFALLMLELWFRIYVDHEKGWISC